MNVNTNLVKVLNKSYEGKWVALSSNRSKVLGSADKLVELKNKINDKDALYMKVLASDTSFAF